MLKMKQIDFWPSVSKALFDSDLIAVRLCLGLSELFWALMLLWAGDTFLRPTYHVMSLVMHEEAWALTFLISSITQFSIVLMSDYDGKFPKYFAGWNAGLWGFTVVAMLLSVYPPPAAIGGEMALAVAALWIFIRPYILAAGYRRTQACWPETGTP